MVDAMIVRWSGGQKVPGYSANRIATFLSPGSVRFGPISNGFAVAAGGGNAAQRLGLGAPQRSNVRQQNVNDESHFNARPRASAARDQIRQGVTRAHPQWARRSGPERCGRAL